MSIIYFTDIEEMAKSSEIEAVYIASPNSVHFEQALTFLKNKKHVICEKPIFSNTAELEKLIRLQRKMASIYLKRFEISILLTFES